MRVCIKVESKNSLPRDILSLLNFINYGKDAKETKVTLDVLLGVLNTAVKDINLMEALNKQPNFTNFTPLQAGRNAIAIVSLAPTLPVVDRAILKKVIEFIILKAGKPELEDLFNGALDLPDNKGKSLTVLIQKMNGQGRLGIDGVHLETLLLNNSTATPC